MIQGPRIPKPHQVRIKRKSLNHSLEKVSVGIFNKSGQGSRTYHERNIKSCELFLSKWGYLEEVWLKPRPEPELAFPGCVHCQSMNMHYCANPGFC